MATTATDSTSAGSSSGTAYDRLIRLVREASLLGSTGRLLEWDQRTMMPAAGVEFRSRQLAQLARMVHTLQTDPRIGELLAKCEADKTLTADPTSESAVNLREIRREYDRATKLPTELVEALAKTRTIAEHEWAEARQANSFARFKPWLEKLVTLLREAAACFGWDQAGGGEPWDALADGYEPGCTARQVEAIFTPLRHRLAPLVAELTETGCAPANPFNELSVPIEQQKKFVRFVAEQIGFDFSRGRLDTSTHPFCGGTHRNDIRLTTRFHDNNVIDALGSTMHEAGHGIYNQHLPGGDSVGTPMGEPVSLGIHESQSRLWENQVGRSRAFWQWCCPKLKAFFGSAVAGLTPDDVYGAANIVRPDFIRVEADEVTYNLHVMVRFEIERSLIKGDLTVADLPHVWNQKYKQYLGIDVPDDACGCLQDIHWSTGSIGYFPTYTLGNLYAAQFFEKALDQMPDLDDQFAAGRFTGLRMWLNDKIHAHAKRYRAADLCEHVTGRPLSPDPLIRHLEGKLRPLYGL